jgi:hypothetical protein
VRAIHEVGRVPAHGRHQRFHPHPPLGAQDGPAAAEEPPPLVTEAKEENCSSILALPQAGHSKSGPTPVFQTSFSKTAPQAEQQNS